MKKKIIGLLSVILACTCVTGCFNKPGGTGSDNSGDSSGSSFTGSYVDATDPDIHLVSEDKLLHKKTVKEVGRAFCVNGSTEYAIIVGTDSSSAREAASFLATQIEQCTGAVAKVYYDTDQDMSIDDELLTDRDLTYTENKKYIVFSHEAMEEAAGIVWETGVDLAYSGYMIKSAGNSVFMKVNSLYGYQTVSQAFLREVLGYEWYSEDTIVYTKDGSTLPDMDIVEKPDFDLVDRSGYISKSGQIASGMTSEKIFTYIDGQFCHNSFDYLPPATYNKSDSHYKWYAGSTSDEYNVSATQLCYSARGDQAEYDEMLQTAYEAVMKTLDSQPNAAALTFTRQDEYGNCECPVCSAMKNEYGSLTATYMLFVNDLDDLVQAELTRRAEESGTEKREVTLLFFAYRETCEAPVKGTDGNYTICKATVQENGDGEMRNTVVSGGEVVELPYHRTYENGLVCNENVGVFYAPIDATYEESFYHAENKAYKTNFEKWALLSNRLYGWIYDTNFVHWLVPYNSFDSIAETLRFLKSNNCQYVFNQAQNNAVCTGFGTLKTYLNLTLARNVNANSGELIDKFFENYFKDAAEPMREYYESLVGHMQQLEEQYPEVFYTQRRTDSESIKYWPLATMQSWLKLCDKAYAAVEKYKTSDPELYNTLVRHIKIETLFPRFMICEYYSGYYTNAEIQSERQSFYDDCTELNYQYYAENVYLTSWYEKWGIV